MSSEHLTVIPAIAVGGAAGAVMRFLTATAVYDFFGRSFPYGTLSVNVLGSLLMGFLAHFMTERLSLGIEWRAAVLIGFLGSFTTFSAFSMETLNLMNDGEILKAGLNIIFSVAVCLIAVWLGLLLARQL